MKSEASTQGLITEGSDRRLRPRAMGSSVKLQHWEREFERLLSAHSEQSEVDGPLQGAERRRYPRIKVGKELDMGKKGIRATLVNSSPSGMALDCDHQVPLGSVITVTVGKAFLMNAAVVACRQVFNKMPRNATKFRVNCHFEYDFQGTQLLFAITELNTTVEITALRKPV